MPSVSGGGGFGKTLRELNPWLSGPGFANALEEISIGRRAVVGADIDSMYVEVSQSFETAERRVPDLGQSRISELHPYYIVVISYNLYLLLASSPASEKPGF